MTVFFFRGFGKDIESSHVERKVMNMESRPNVEE